MDEKKRHSAPVEARAPSTAWRSPKETMSSIEYCRRRRSVAHCALNNSIFAARRSDAMRAIPVCLLDSSFDIYYSSVSKFFVSGECLPEPFTFGEGCNAKPDGSGRTRLAGTILSLECGYCTLLVEQRSSYWAPFCSDPKK